MNFIDQPFIDSPMSPPPDDRKPGIDMKRILRRLLRGSPIIILATLAGLFAGYTALRVLPPQFTSSVSILIDPKQPGALGSDTEFANIYVDASKIDNVEVVLLSSDLLQRVVRAEHLADTSEFGDPRPSILERLLPSSSPGDVHTSTDNAAIREARAIDRLRQHIRTARVGMTYVIDIDVTWASAAGAQRIAKALADAYFNDQLDTKIDADRRDSAWLTERMQAQRDELMRSDSAVEAIRKQYGVIGGDSSADSTVDRQSEAQVNEQLVKAQGDVAAAEARYDQAKHVLQFGGNLEALPDVSASKVIEDLRRQQDEASQQLADLSVRYASSHPLRRQAEQNLAAVNRQISQEVSRVVSGLRNDFETASAHRDALQKELAKLVATVTAAANANGRVELREAERIAEANRAAYDASLNKLHAVQQLETRQDVEARIISAPEIPERPSSPKAKLCLPLGGAVGLLLGLGIVLLVPISRAKVEDMATAERDFYLPVLGMAPYMREGHLQFGGRQLTIPEYVMRNPFSRFSESLRVVRLRLKRLASRSAQVVQITSSVPGEGKSTIAASIAISAAAAGTRTVLVDLDLHHPSAGRLLGNTQTNGVVDVLLGTALTTSALQAHTNFPITTISAGSITRMHPGLIESAQLHELIAELSREFDLVVLDTPPVLAISDPLYISKLVDATLLIVAWRSTPQECVDDALTALRGAGAPLVGLFMNKVNLARTGRYGGKDYGYERTETV